MLVFMGSDLFVSSQTWACSDEELLIFLNFLFRENSESRNSRTSLRFLPVFLFLQIFHKLRFFFYLNSSVSCLIFFFFYLVLNYSFNFSLERVLHWISQNGSLLVTSLLVCSWSWLFPPSLLGLDAPSSSEPPVLPWGHIDCHLSASVDTIGGRQGLLSSILSISFIMFVLSFGMSWNVYNFVHEIDPSKEKNIRKGENIFFSFQCQCA